MRAHFGGCSPAALCSFITNVVVIIVRFCGEEETVVDEEATDRREKTG
jgi:hypothetical protein